MTIPRNDRNRLPLLMCLLLLTATASAPYAGTTATWVSQGLGGSQPFTNVGGEDLAMSGDGRYVVFSAESKDLTPDSKGVRQVYLRDMTSGAIQLLSKNAAGEVGNYQSRPHSISANGRYVTFKTDAQNLLPNSQGEVIWLDRTTGAMRIATLNSAGATTTGSATESKVSENGRYVVFSSSYHGYVPGDTNPGYSDVFLRDVIGNTTVCISSVNGVFGNQTSTGGLDFSGDNRYVAFKTRARNLINDPSNLGHGLLLYNIQAQTLEQVSLNDSDQPLGSFVDDPSVDGTGNRIAFHHEDDVYVRDRATGRTYRASLNTIAPRRLDLSSNGRVLAYSAVPNPALAGNTNPGRHVYFRDLSAAAPLLVSKATNGVLANGTCDGAVAISSSGNFIAFQSKAKNLDPNDHNGQQDVFRRTRFSSTTQRVSCLPGGGDATTDAKSSGVSMTPDGRYVAFMSNAVNLVAGDTNERADAFVYDRNTGQNTIVPVPLNVVPETYSGSTWATTLSTNGRYCAASWSVPAAYPGNSTTVVHTITDRQTSDIWRVTSPHYGMRMSGNGRYLAFFDYVSNLQVIVFDRVAGVATVESWRNGGGLGNASVPIHRPGVSNDGRYITFLSNSTDLVTGDTNNQADVFVRDRTAGITTRVSVGPTGTQVNQPSFTPTASLNGDIVVFIRENHVWMKNRTTGALTQMDKDNATPVHTAWGVGTAVVSAGGRFVLFPTNGNDFPGGIPGRPNLWVKETSQGSVRWVPSGDPPTSGSDPFGVNLGDISTDGLFVSYSTHRTGVVPGDTGIGEDVFLIRRS